MKPPTCRTCGKAEFSHLCLGPSAPRALKGAVARKALKQGATKRKPPKAKKARA